MTTADPRPSEFRTRDGVRLNVADEGPADAPVTVVLVHGWTLSMRTWDRVAAGLPAAAGSSLRILRFDLRGHGGSDGAPAGSGTIERCADDLAELIAERVPDGPVVLAGHSMGGMSLMALAERHPELVRQRVRGVAFVASAAGGLAKVALGLPHPLSEVAYLGEQALARGMGRLPGRRAVRRSAPLRPGLRWLLFGRRPRRADIAAAAEAVAACEPRAFAEFRWSLAEHERAGSLEPLRSLPCVVLGGFADRLTPYRQAQRIAEELPDARLIGYGGAGHMLPLERTEEVTARLAELIRPVLADTGDRGSRQSAAEQSTAG
ncbi:alpha/beta hydrolase [Salinifilum aidingensis]